MAKQLTLQIWSDIACPWCYVGKRRLEAALARFPEREHVHTTWRSFQLDPGAPAVREPESYARRLARKYGSSVAHAESMIARMVEIAKTDGLTFDFDQIRPGNTFDAHRLLHLARDLRKQDALKERLFRAYLSEGAAIGDRSTLTRLGSEVDIDPDRIDSVLSTDQYTREVREDEAAARRIGIHGVPFFVLADHYAVEGAQPADLLLEALTRAWSELPDIQRLEVPEGAAVCGPEGCE